MTSDCASPSKAGSSDSKWGMASAVHRSPTATPRTASSESVRPAEAILARLDVIVGADVRHDLLQVGEAFLHLPERVQPERLHAVADGRRLEEVGARALVREPAELVVHRQDLVDADAALVA